MGKKRLVYIDYLKILAMLGVVMSHSIALGLNDHKFSIQWHITNTLLGIVSPAVGIFFMVSGALILSSPNTDSIHYLLTHRILKIGIPFLIWSGISLGVFSFLNGDANWGTWLHLMLSIYNRYPIIPFWFLYPLIGFYLLSPLLKAFVDNTSTKTLDYILILWFVTNIVLPFFATVLPGNIGDYFQYSKQFNLIFLGRSLGYFLLGYRLSKISIKQNTLSSNVSSMILLFLITIILNFENNFFHWNIPVIGYTSIVAVLLASEIFLVIRKIDYYHPITRYRRHTFRTIASLSYGVYLTHGIVIQSLAQGFGLENAIVVFFITTIVCLLFTYLISKIPYLRFWLLGMD